VRLPLYALPLDLDVYLHVNNGRYLTLMDNGRFAWGVRTGLARELCRKRWTPVLGGAAIRFRREIRAFDRLELVTRLASWDEKWLFLEQRFERGGRIVADARVRAVVRAKGRTVPPSKVLALVGHEGPAPSPPPTPESWG
jgi:acyl-CoA thioesterase FadM